jgi:hypothetical protein
MKTVVGLRRSKRKNGNLDSKSKDSYRRTKKRRSVSRGKKKNSEGFLGLGRNYDTTFAPVIPTPEPSSLSLMLIGLVALGTLAAVSKRKTPGQMG